MFSIYTNMVALNCEFNDANGVWIPCFFLINLFIYFWLCGVFVAAHGLSLVVGATLCCGARAFHCSGFSCCRARALGVWASVVVACSFGSCGSRAVEHRLSSCGAWA